MPVALESRESTPGIRIMEADNDKIFIYSGKAFLQNLEYLQDVYAQFAQKDVGWSPEYARYLATRGLGVDHLTKGSPLDDQTIRFILDNPLTARKVPSVMLFREQDSNPGEYLGFSAQRMYYPMVAREEGQQEEEVPVLYHIFRAFESASRGKHRGRMTVQLALLIHGAAEWYYHRTGNHVAAYTNTESTSFDHSEMFPWVQPFDANQFAFSVAKKLSALVNPEGTPIDRFGVSRGAYREPNRQVVPRPEHAPSMAFYNRMFGPAPENFNMGPLDAVLPLLKIA